MELGFCVEGVLSENKCKNFTFYEFPTPKDTIVLILAYFKQFVPEIAKRKLDYYNQQIIIDPNDVGLVVQKELGKYVVVISIADDVSSYPEGGYSIERTEYAFQIDLLTSDEKSEAALENLLTLQNIVKTLLVSMEDNLGLTTNVNEFNFTDFGLVESTNKIVRQGIYRFSVEANNQKRELK